MTWMYFFRDWLPEIEDRILKALRQGRYVLMAPDRDRFPWNRPEGRPCREQWPSTSEQKSTPQ